jgi:acetylornithine deacetylase
MTTDMQPVLDILARLIAFPTVSDQSNRALTTYVSEYLSTHDVPHHIFPDETGEKDGLIAQIGPNVAGGVVLSGHTDVVPVEGQVWTSDPWVLTQRDGKFFGRGSCDMKGFLALALAAVPDMIQARLNRPIQLAFSFDEETGCKGTAPLLRELERRFPRAASVVVGEPTEMRVVTGHKGGIGITTQIHGKAAHSSLPDLGVSAISYAAQLIQWHDARMQSVQANADSTSPFSPPHATLQVGTISGGSAVNIVPDLCTLESDIRYMPGERGEDGIAA